MLIIMDQQTVIIEIEQRAQRARVSIASLCRRVGISPSTFWRWKATELNPDPTGASLLSIGRLYAELDKIDAEDARRLWRSGKAVAA